MEIPRQTFSRWLGLCAVELEPVAKGIRTGVLAGGYVQLDETPIDYLDFASPVAGLGSKMGIDATNKWPAETTRNWGKAITMDPAVTERVEALWRELKL